jgi:hypothetical protein
MPDRSYLHALLDALDIGIMQELFGATWYILAAKPGWCALRRGGGVICWDGPQSLIQHCVRAERLGDLAGQLCLQEFLATLTEDELARVYAAGEIPGDLVPARRLTSPTPEEEP